MVAPEKCWAGGGYAENSDAHVTPPSLRESRTDSTATTILDDPPTGNRFSGCSPTPLCGDPKVREEKR
jgi:hypothetical protein